MQASQFLQQLHHLPPSSSKFSRVLSSFIRSDKEEEYSQGLQGEELTRLIDILDNALCHIHSSDNLYRQCLRKLRAICGSHETLPSSHVISGDLTRIGRGAVAYGGFADVWQGDIGGETVCIKVLRIPLNDPGCLKKLFFGEAVVWKRLGHTSVVPFLGVTLEPLQFVSEWMPNGTLTDYVTKYPSVDRIALLLDVAEGLDHLHNNHMIHGDLKGSNILIKSDGHACLADFGLASIAHGNNSIVGSKVHGYSPGWAAPEILKNADKITTEADVFSFGMVVIGAFTGKNPFSELAAQVAILRTINGDRPTYPQGTESLGFVTPIWDMTVNCWLDDPSHRPMMTTVVEFLRECYLAVIIDPAFSKIPPWKPTANAQNVPARGWRAFAAVITPASFAKKPTKRGHDRG